MAIQFVKAPGKLLEGDKMMEIRDYKRTGSSHNLIAPLGSTMHLAHNQLTEAFDSIDAEMSKTGIWFVLAFCYFLGKQCASMEIEEFETVYNENHPIRKEFDIHTETCFKHFKSSLVRLTLLFLDPENSKKEGLEGSKCWIKCMLEQFKFIKIDEGQENGEILPGSIMEKASELSDTTRYRLNEIFQKCELDSRATIDLCDKAYIFVHCVFEMYRGQNIITVVPAVTQAQPVIVNVKQPVVVPPKRTTVIKRPIIVTPVRVPPRHPLPTPVNQHVKII